VVRCGCGQSLAVPAVQAGQCVRCPACAAVLVVPETSISASEPTGYAVQQPRKCPYCNKEWPAETGVCVECGWNFHTAKRHQRTYPVLDRHVDFGLTAIGTCTRLAVHRGNQGDRTLTRKDWLLFIPLGTSVLDLDGYEAVVTDYSSGGSEYGDSFILDLRAKDNRTRRIYAGSDEPTMKAIVDMLQEVGQLRVERK
jgi:hypothetical protein